MDARELAVALADPIQSLGAAFYFADGTRERAGAQGLNVYQFYGLGRAGVMGNVEPAVVREAFAFFHPDVIDVIYSQPRDTHDPAGIAAAHLDAAFAFADQNFATLDSELLEGVVDATRRVIDGVEVGRYPLVDGYRRAAATGVVHGAYLAAIQLRELRGAVHIEAVARAALTPVQACYLQDPSVFALHGYHDEDVPVMTADLPARKERAEAFTDESMAQYLDVVDEAARASLLDGVRAMAAALAGPVAAS
jgi:hypothetical protein